MGTPYLVTPDGRKWVPVEVPPPDEPPEPQPFQPVGWIPDPNDKPFRVKPSGYFQDLQYPTDTVPAREYIVSENRVQPHGTVVTHLDQNQTWMQQMVNQLTLYIAQLFVSHSYGFNNGDEEGTELDQLPDGTVVVYTVDENGNQLPAPWKLESIDCGTNLRCGTEFVQSQSGEKYIRFKAQSLGNQPDPDATYDRHPELTVVQVNAVRDTDLRRTASGGHVEFPLVCQKPLAHRLVDARFYPDLSREYTAFIYGRLATIDKTLFRRNEVWVRVSGGELDEGWYIVDYYKVPENMAQDHLPGKSEYFVSKIKNVVQDGKLLEWPGETPVECTWTKSGKQ